MLRAFLIACGYYLTLCMFGFFGLALSLLGLALGIWPRGEKLERWFQRRIHHRFRLFVRWVGFFGLVRVRYRGLERLPPDGRGLVIAANHPGLADITWLLARLPEAVCIFKPAIRRNPVLGAAARRAGYVASDGGHEVVRNVADKLASGHKLVIFPEGTRTPPGQAILPFKPGFVLMAQRGGVPIQLVRIEYSRRVLGKDRAWWKTPPLPADVTVTVGPCFAAPPRSASIAELNARIEAWFRAEAAGAAGAPDFSAEGAFVSPAPLSTSP